MKFVGVVLLLFGMGVPLFVSAQQPLPPLPNPPKLPLAITDKAAIDEWSKAIYDGPADPKAGGDTQFLLSLNEEEWLGRFRYRQRCALCHNSANAIGPQLSHQTIQGKGVETVRRHIMEGSPRMPAFKYSIEPTTVDAIVAYLKKVDPQNTR
jgi:mono/diheme cytochrome c family protein